MQSQAMPFRDYTNLRVSQIEKIFIQTVFDLKQIVVLDGIDFHDFGFCVRCHDLYGPLSVIRINDSGDTFAHRDRLENEICKLIAITRIRDRVRRWLPDGKFLLPTRLDSWVIVGYRVGSKTWMAEGADTVRAYHALDEQVFGCKDYLDDTSG
ncbi:MAG: hypothetical protein H6Q04_1712 [Acidobacteria bacterium]|nr:hypothetical protein [Acidobacteriota bacterium]